MPKYVHEMLREVLSQTVLPLRLGRFSRLLEVKRYADVHCDGDMERAIIALVNSGLSHDT